MFGELVNDQQLMTEVGAYETSQSIPGDISNNDDMEGGSDHTNSSSSDTSAELEVKCTRCKLFFPTRNEMLEHRSASHPAPNRFRCEECPQDFASQGSLWKHHKIHTGDRKYVCHTCHRSFNQLANLQRHYLVHSGEKPFACLVCSKRFSQQTNVDKHQVTHTKIKPFPCTLCPKSFTQRANLVKHQLVHSGERPHECPTCFKRYAQQSNMKKHMQTHEKRNNSIAYLCAKCQKLFSTVLLYSRHLNTCTGANEDYQFEFGADGTDSNNLAYIKIEETME